jgi:hypothetical protein
MTNQADPNKKGGEEYLEMQTQKELFFKRMMRKKVISQIQEQRIRRV